jgi:hypothetical protein
MMKVKGRGVVIGLGIAAVLTATSGTIVFFATHAPYAIYGSDANAEHVILRSRVMVRESLPLLDKLRILARALSEREFGSLPIEPLRIETREGKTVAVIDLRESEANRAIFQESGRLVRAGKVNEAEALRSKLEKPRWMGGFFEGSTGGAMTGASLDMTFLQPDRRGEWIDGVAYLYEGAEPPELDHINLGVTWREELRAWLRERSNR